MPNNCSSEIVAQLFIIFYSKLKSIDKVSFMIYRIALFEFAKIDTINIFEVWLSSSCKLYSQNA